MFKEICFRISRAILIFLSFFKKIDSDFLFVHIRNGDFANFDFFRDNFVHNKNIWEEAIVSVCLKEKIKNIEILNNSDEFLKNISYFLKFAYKLIGNNINRDFKVSNIIFR